jgi:hypothetical protein
MSWATRPPDANSESEMRKGGFQAHRASLVRVGSTPRGVSCLSSSAVFCHLLLLLSLRDVSCSSYLQKYRSLRPSLNSSLGKNPVCLLMQPTIFLWMQPYGEVWALLLVLCTMLDTNNTAFCLLVKALCCVQVFS